VGFSIGDNGSLAHISTINAGANATEIVANSKFVFVGDSQHRPSPIQLISYSIGGSGDLTMADQANFSNSDDTMTGFVLDSTGTHLYAGSESATFTGRVSTYTVDGASGHMTFQAPDNGLGKPVGHMALSPNGTFFYVAVFPQHHSVEFPGIRLLLRDPPTGTLTDTGREFPTTCCDQYTDLAFALGGKYLIGVQDNGVSVSNNNKITVFAVDPATGDLTKASELRGDFSDITVDRTGNFAIVTNTTGTVVSYRVNADGTLSAATSATALAGVNNVVVDAVNKFVFVQSSTTPQIFAFTFNESSGALDIVPGSPFTTSAVPVRMAAVEK
jgi:6-phosphogluconolactonase (cycloisomerase 2 family)